MLFDRGEDRDSLSLTLMETGEILARLNGGIEALSGFNGKELGGYFSITNVRLNVPILVIMVGKVDHAKADEYKGLAESYANFMHEHPRQGSSRETHPNTMAAAVSGPDWIMTFAGIHCIEAEMLLLMLAFKTKQLSLDQVSGLAKRTENPIFAQLLQELKAEERKRNR